MAHTIKITKKHTAMYHPRGCDRSTCEFSRRLKRPQMTPQLDGRDGFLAGRYTVRLSEKDPNGLVLVRAKQKRGLKPKGGRMGKKHKPIGWDEVNMSKAIHGGD